ncbi:thermonuclease family protein [Phormidesmis sp. 146-33]
MKRKVLMNLIPVGAIVIITSVIGLQAWQKSQAAKPDYENSSATYSARSRGQLPETKTYQVKRVSDGDTIVLKNGDKVRFCGIDAPESGQPFGRESKANLQKLIDAARGQVMVMETDRDRYGRIVGEVFVKTSGSEEKYLNGEQVRSGLAYEYKKYSKSCPNRDAISTSEQRAKSERKGVWSGNYQRPWDYRRKN